MVILDNGSTDRQANPHAVISCGEEGIKDSAQVLRD